MEKVGTTEVLRLIFRTAIFLTEDELERVHLSSAAVLNKVAWTCVYVVDIREDRK